MNRAELKYIEALLLRIKDPDAKVAKAVSLVQKDLAAYDARAGQLRETYELEHPW